MECQRVSEQSTSPGELTCNEPFYNLHFASRVPLIAHTPVQAKACSINFKRKGKRKSEETKKKKMENSKDKPLFTYLSFKEQFPQDTKNLLSAILLKCVCVCVCVCATQ